MQEFYSDSGNTQIIENIAQEITASSRKKDVEQLIERIARPDCKLTVIHGKPGVGKTSILQSGLIPALKKEVLGNRKVLTIFQQDYDNWIENLGNHLVGEIDKKQNVSPSATKLNNFYYRETEHRQFYDFLDQCLNIPYTEVVLSLRDDSLYHLLDWNRVTKSEVVNRNILDRQFLYDLEDFSLKDARLIIEGLTEKTQFFLEISLIDEIIEDLRDISDKIMPCELQILCYQLEKEQFSTLRQYKKNGSKHGLIKLYLEEVIQDCGIENEKIAKQVLYYLTDEENKHCRDRNRTSLEELLEVATNKLEPILHILMKSWLLIQTPLFQDKRYKLASSYLLFFINEQKDFIVTAELKQTKQQLRESLLQAEIAEIEQLSLLAQAQFLSNNQLVALVNAVKASKNLLKTQLQSEIKTNILDRLRQIVYEVKEINRLEGHQDSVWTVNISSNGQLIASASFDGIVKLWKLDGTFIRDFQAHNDWIWSVTFSNDDQMLASASDDQTIKLWKLDGTLIDTFKGHSGGVKSVRFNPNGQILASASDDKTIKLWKLDGTLIKTFRGHKDWVWDLSFNRDGQMLASASADKTLKLWKLDGTLIKTFIGHSSGVRSVRFSPDGHILASASADGAVKLWQLNGTEIQTFSGHSAGVRGIGFSPDSKILASGSADKTVRLWQVDGIALETLKGHIDCVWGIAFNPNHNLLASVSADKTVRLWGLDDKSRKTFQGHYDLVRGISFSSNGEMLASGSSDGIVRIWKIDGTLIKIFQGHEAKVWSVRFSLDDQKLASASDDQTVKLWSLDGKEIQTFHGHEAGVRSVHFSPDGQKLASASADGFIKIWKIDNGTEIKSFQGHEAGIRSMSFSLDGKMLASASADETVKIWQLDDIRNDIRISEINTFLGHNAGVWSVKFSPDGQMLASGSSDLTIKLWNIDGTEIHTFRGHKAAILSVSFSYDSKTLASAGADRTIRLWRLDKIEPQPSDLEEILKHGCKWLQNYLKTNPNVNESDRSLCDLNTPILQYQSSDIDKELRETKQQLQATLE